MDIDIELFPEDRYIAIDGVFILAGKVCNCRRSRSFQQVDCGKEYEELASVSGGKLRDAESIFFTFHRATFFLASIYQ